jgi:hypothetical protein
MERHHPDVVDEYSVDNVGPSISAIGYHAFGAKMKASQVSAETYVTSGQSEESQW